MQNIHVPESIVEKGRDFQLEIIAVSHQYSNKSYTPDASIWKKSSWYLAGTRTDQFSFIIKIIAISIFFTALLMSINTFSVSFQMIVLGVSLLAGFIIEFMFSGDKYE